MATLNAEPALPEEREKQHLPPKSYADAVEEEPPANGVNGINGAKEMNGTDYETNGTNDAGRDDAKSTAHTASVLKIVDTGAPAAEEKKQDRPQNERQQSKREYSATVCICFLP
jgi:2-acylglycerol O-acyltransferase 2